MNNYTADYAECIVDSHMLEEWLLNELTTKKLYVCEMLYIIISKFDHSTKYTHIETSHDCWGLSHMDDAKMAPGSQPEVVLITSGGEEVG